MTVFTRSRIIRPRGLWWPGGTPGFDPTHPASRGISPGHGFSGVASGANVVSLLTGKTGTAYGNPVNAGVDTVLGPVMDSSPGGAKQFTGQLSTTETAVTLAWIGKITSFPSIFTGVVSTGAANGYDLTFRNNNTFILIGSAAGSGPVSANAISLGVPYFIAVSGIPGQKVTNFILKNLNTNVTLYDQNTSTNCPTELANGTTYGVGADLSSGAANALTAAAMFAPNYMSRDQLLFWAANPWAFWYPK